MQQIRYFSTPKLCWVCDNSLVPSVACEAAQRASWPWSPLYPMNQNPHRAVFTITTNTQRETLTRRCFSCLAPFTPTNKSLGSSRLPSKWKRSCPVKERLLFYYNKHHLFGWNGIRTLLLMVHHAVWVSFKQYQSEEIKSWLINSSCPTHFFFSSDWITCKSFSWFSSSSS